MRPLELHDEPESDKPHDEKDQTEQDIRKHRPGSEPPEPANHVFGHDPALPGFLDILHVAGEELVLRAELGGESPFLTIFLDNNGAHDPVGVAAAEWPAGGVVVIIAPAAIDSLDGVGRIRSAPLGSELLENLLLAR